MRGSSTWKILAVLLIVLVIILVLVLVLGKSCGKPPVNTDVSTSEATTVPTEETTSQTVRPAEPNYISEDDILELARKHGQRYNVDPLLILAIARVESGFNANAVSSSGAMGLTQILPDTYTNTIKNHILSGDDPNVLFDPDVSVKACSYYLYYLQKKVDGLPEILAAYNYGITNVLNMLNDTTGKYTEDGKTLIIDSIPSAETRNYVKKVQEWYGTYTEKYGNN